MEGSSVSQKRGLVRSIELCSGYVIIAELVVFAVVSKNNKPQGR